MTPEEKNARLKQALALEIGAGASWDIATGGLMIAPPVYAGLNFLQGAGTNLLAQWWRGEENIAWGEVLASGGVGLVPGAAGSVSGAKAIGRVAAKAAGTGVAHEGIRLGIDEQRLPTLQEAGIAAGLGGVIGGGISGATQLGGQLKKQINELVQFPSSVGAGGWGGRRGDYSHFIPEHKLANLKKQETWLAMSPSEQQRVIDTIEPMDYYDVSRVGRLDYNPASPTKGYSGTRFVTMDDGTELGIGAGKKGYQVYNAKSSKASRLKRFVWAESYSNDKSKVEAGFAWKGKKEANAKSEEILQRLRDSPNLEEQDLFVRLVGGTKPYQIEHIANQDSNVWTKIYNEDGTLAGFRHRYKTTESGQLIAPGDIENLRLVGIYDFKYVKDHIEDHMRRTGLNKLYHLEMDSSNNIVVMHSTSGIYPNGQPFRADTPVAPRSINPIEIKGWDDTAQVTTIHRSIDRDDAITSFEHIVNRGERLPLPRSEDHRRTFAAWFADPEGGNMGNRDLGYTMLEKEILDNNRIIIKAQKRLLSDKVSATERVKLEAKIKKYQELNLAHMKGEYGIYK